MKVKLTDITEVIRSKNAGPYELTFDIMFKSREWFEKVCQRKIINKDLICDLYKITPAEIINIVEFTQAFAIKVTIKRAIASGDLGEKDVYGAQQHAPLLQVEFESEAV